MISMITMISMINMIKHDKPEIGATHQHPTSRTKRFHDGSGVVEIRQRVGNLAGRVGARWLRREMICSDRGRTVALVRR